MKRPTFIELAAMLALIIAYVTPNRAVADVFTINSSQYNDGTENLAPYSSTWNGIAIQSFCIDLNSQVGFGQQFNVTTINLSDYQGPNQLAYWEAGFLAFTLQQFVAQPNPSLGAISNLNKAIWYITTPDSQNNGYLNTPGVNSWVVYAQLNFNTIAQSDITLYLKDGAGQSQLSVIPEPSTWAIALIGLVSLIGFLRLGHKQRASRKQTNENP